MVEQLYDEVIKKLRKYVNSVNRSKIEDVTPVEDFLRSLIRRTDFLLNQDRKYRLLEDRLLRELKKLSKSIFIVTNNEGVYRDKLQKSIDRLTWINLKHKINTSSRRYTVAQR